MGKRKIRKFQEIETFSNVFQPSLDEVFGKDYSLKNNWAKNHFQNDHPIILELGCGKGEYTVGLAGIFPGKNFIGIDLKGDRIWTGARQAQMQKIPNAAFVRTRIEFIESLFGRNEVNEIWLTFPDPQLKTRRNKKRLTASRFLNSYRNILKDKGLIHLKTDNAVLYHYTLELVEANKLPLVFSTNDLYKSAQSGMVHGITTYYEKKFIEEGLNIHYLSFKLPSDKIIKEPATG
ncbi:tRNA (guanosine(46)-N7)-methyltransferase TrmB [Bacteroidota bacterium]